MSSRKRGTVSTLVAICSRNVAMSDFNAGETYFTAECAEFAEKSLGWSARWQCQLTSNFGESISPPSTLSTLRKSLAGVRVGNGSLLPTSERAFHRRDAEKGLGWGAQASDDFGSALTVVTNVPGIDRFGFGFEGAMGKHGVVDFAANDSERGRRAQGVSVFIRIQSDYREAIANVADEEHCLSAADAALARHSRQSGINLGQTVRSAAAGRLVRLDEDFLTRAVVDVVAVEQRN